MNRHQKAALTTFGGMVLVMRYYSGSKECRDKENFPPDAGITTPDDFYTGMDCAFSMVLDLLEAMEDVNDLSNESLNKMLVGLVNKEEASDNAG